MRRFPARHVTRSRIPLILFTAAGLGVLGIGVQTASAQSSIEWASPVDGDFAVAGNWLPMAVPGERDTAVLGGFGPYLVSVNAATPVDTVLLSNPEASLLLRPGATLSVGDLSGPGSVRISDGSSTVPAELAVANRGAIDAAIVLDGTRLDRARLVGLGSSHTLGPNAVITGNSGSIVGPWTSEATVLKDGPGVISLNGLDIVGGTLRSSGGGLLVLDNASVRNATIEVGPDARFVTNQNTVVSDSTFVGEFTIRSGQDITFGDGVELTDGLVINEPGSIGQARLFVEEGVTLNGPIRLEGSTLGGEIIGLGDGQTLGPDAIITGTRAAIVGRWNSEATIINDGPGGFSLTGLNIVGGTLHSSGGGRLDIAGTTIRNATIEAGIGSAFRTTVTTNISDTTIVGDLTILGGRLTFGDGVELQGDLTLGIPGVPGQTQLYAEDEVTLDSPIRLAGIESELFGIGLSHTLGPDAVLTVADGRITGAWTNEGTISIGDVDDPIGLLQLSGPNLTLAPTSLLEFEIAGSMDDRFDRIESTEVVTLGGRLSVEFQDGYAPDPRDRIEIIRATVVDRVFDELTVEPFGAPGPAHVVYTGDSVVVVICAADRDADGVLTIFDFLEYQNQFDAGDPQADLDGDGRLTLFDFLAFQNRFDAGCE